MNRAFLILTFVLVAIIVKAQQSPPAKLKDPDGTTLIRIDQPMVGDSSKILSSVEQVPMPEGGIEGFSLYLRHNIRYPAKSIEEKKQGTVLLGFIVETDGSLTKIKVIKGVSPEIDQEAIRVLAAAPKWSPGIKDGKAVKVNFAVPIKFQFSK